MPFSSIKSLLRSGERCFLVYFCLIKNLLQLLRHIIYEKIPLIMRNLLKYLTNYGEVKYPAFLHKNRPLVKLNSPGCPILHNLSSGLVALYRSYKDKPLLEAWT